jgi:hypothetical protein
MALNYSAKNKLIVYRITYIADEVERRNQALVLLTYGYTVRLLLHVATMP